MIHPIPANETSENIMANTRSTEIKPSPIGGRGLFATEAIAPGEALLCLDRPLVTTLDAERIHDTCAWCFAWTELPVLSGAGVNQATTVNWCTGCKKVKYCSRACQSKAWKAVHKRECKIFAAQEEVVPNVVVAVMQMMDGICQGKEEYQALLGMENHREEFEKAGGKRLEAMRLMAHTALNMMGEKEKVESMRPILMAMCCLMCNSSRLVTATFDPLGLALDPISAAINHSCEPNAVVLFDGPRLSVRALKGLKKGEEVLISYIDSSAPCGVRQAELKDQYFFTCQCTKCKKGTKAPQDAFLSPGPDFDEKIRVIDDMIPQIETDPAWPRHILGTSPREKQLSALQFYAYSYLHGPDAVSKVDDAARLRKPIQICRNTGIWPLTRAPLPGLYQQYAVACLTGKRYNEALVAMIRLNFVIDPVIYPQQHHPVRVVHAWTLATLAKALSSEQDSPFGKALQACGVDLSMLFLGLLLEIRDQVPKSHGSQSQFAKMVEAAWQTMMEPGGELDVQYSQMGVGRSQWQTMLRGQVNELWPKIKAFAEDEGIAQQIDEALAET